MPHTEIRPEILGVAIEKLEQIGGPSTAQSIDGWIVARHERQRSVLYRLTDSASGTTLYYKVISEPRYEVRADADSLWNRLNRTESLTDRLLDETSGTSVSPAPVLAADANHRTIVTLGVDGREIKGGILRTLMPSRMLSSKQAALIGEACAHVERCSDDREVTFDWERFSRQIDKRLTRLQTDRKVASRVRSQLHQAASHCLATRAPVYTHGDLSSTNILVSSEKVYVIDFSWFSGFRGYDLGLFSYRLRARDNIHLGRGPRLRESLMNAYKSAAGSRYHCLSLKVVDLFLMVRGLESPSRKTRTLAHRALDRVTTDSWEDEGDFRWWWEATK